MEEREEEISFVLDMIDKLCVEYNIALLPKETKKGVKYVGVLDIKTGKEYAMIKQK